MYDVISYKEIIMLKLFTTLLNVLPKVKSLLIKDGKFKLDRATYFVVVLVVLMICNSMFGTINTEIGLDLLMQFMTILENSE